MSNYPEHVEATLRMLLPEATAKLRQEVLAPTMRAMLGPLTSSRKGDEAHRATVDDEYSPPHDKNDLHHLVQERSLLGSVPPPQSSTLS